MKDMHIYAPVLLLLVALANGQVSVRSGTDEGYEAFVVTTPTATYHLQKTTGGLSSLVDKDGNDWIDHHQTGDSRGNYRGIPNLGPFHPGPGYEGVTTTLLNSTDDKASIKCVKNGYECVWDFHATHAVMHLTEAHGDYWFLYEGTPGGQMEKSSDYYYLADGTRKLCEEKTEGDFAAPEWICVGDPGLKRMLFLANHKNDSDHDMFWGWNSMTVFGFGRTKYSREMSGAPRDFSIGFVESDNFADVKAFVGQVMGTGTTPTTRPAPRHLRARPEPTPLRVLLNGELIPSEGKAPVPAPGIASGMHIERSGRRKVFTRLLQGQTNH